MVIWIIDWYNDRNLIFEFDFVKIEVMKRKIIRIDMGYVIFKIFYF